MAERNERNEAERVKQAFVFQIVLHAALDRFEVGKKISMG